MTWNTIPNAISNVYGTVTDLLGRIFKSKKVNASMVVVLVDIIIVIQPEFEGFRDPLLQITTIVWGGVVGPFAVQDWIVGWKQGESKYQPKSANG